MNCPRNCHRILSLVAVLILAPWLLQASTEPTPATLEIWAASPSTGIVGVISDGTSRLEFESIFDGSEVRSEIRGAEGRRLWHYVEDPNSPHRRPRIEIDGRTFDGTYSPELIQTLREIGASPEGQLIRALAFDLTLKAAGSELIALRRGLETAYQAMQRGYSDEVRQRPPRPQPLPRSTPDPDTVPGGGVLTAGGSEMDDYLFSKEGGYVVKTQHHSAVFANNFLSNDHERVQSTLGKLPINPLDDPNIGDQCFGMCGKGCTNDFSCRGFKGWAHEWVGTPTSSVTALCYCNVPQQFWEPDCSNVPTGSWKHTVYSTYGTAIHTIRGWSSSGCIAHDWCCRHTFLPCWLDPACNVLAVIAGAECAAGIGWDVSWSYVGPLSYQYATYDQSGCRWDCPDCGSGIFPDPIAVDP